MDTSNNLDYYLSDISNFTSEISQLENHRQKIQESWNKIGDSISNSSHPIDEIAINLLVASKNKGDLKVSAVVGGASLIVKGVGKLVKGIGYAYSEYKVYQKEKKIKQKKIEIATLKINQARKTLLWSEKNFEKVLKVFKNDLSIIVTDFDYDKSLYYEGRKSSFELCFKSLYLLEASRYVIDAYTHWLKNDGREYYNLPPESSQVLEELITMKGGIIGQISKEEFIELILSPIVKSNLMLAIENDYLINHLPLTLYELVKIEKRIPKQSPLRSALKHNKEFKTEKKKVLNSLLCFKAERKGLCLGILFSILTLYELVKIEKRIPKQSPLRSALKHNKEFKTEKKKVFKNRIIFIISCLLNFTNILLLYFWNSFGWWNLLVVPLNILLFLIAYLIRIDRKL